MNLLKIDKDQEIKNIIVSQNNPHPHKEKLHDTKNIKEQLIIKNHQTIMEDLIMALKTININTFNKDNNKKKHQTIQNPLPKHILYQNPKLTISFFQVIYFFY